VSFRPIRGFPFDDVVLSFDGAPLAEDFHLVALSGLAPLIGIEQATVFIVAAVAGFFGCPIAVVVMALIMGVLCLRVGCN